MTPRGAIVLVALPGAYGKARPAVVVQSERVPETFSSVVVCPLTSELRGDLQYFRPLVRPSAGNGLDRPSQVMADKPHVVLRAKLAEPVGVLEAAVMAEVDRALALLLGLA